MPQVLGPVWIPLDDSCRLAVRVWLPDDADQHACPVILERGATVEVSFRDVHSWAVPV